MLNYFNHFVRSKCSSTKNEHLSSFTHPQVIPNYCQLFGSTYLSNNGIRLFWCSHSICFSLLAKKNKKKGKTLTLNDFLANDSSGSVPPNCKSIDRSRLPRSPPYTAFLGNLPYDVSEESIKDFFRGLAISAVRLPREPNNPERLKGFGYAEFDDVESFLRALSLNEENLGNRRIRVDIADQSNDKERDSGTMMGRDRDRGRGMDFGPDKTDSDWRARPSGDQDDGPRKDDGYGDRSRDRYESDRFRDAPRRDDRYDSGRDRFSGRERYDDRGSRDYDRGGYDSRGGGGRRGFSSGFRRDYDDQRDGDREERLDRRDDGREERACLRRVTLLIPAGLPLYLEQPNLWTQLPRRERWRRG
uniref:Eukaryotic translation initiation factor 4B n=1 Tax=Sinocyclocheilus rhinocerous TaxID=307959 RepID=A0A673MWV7_9TELE